MKSIMMSIRPEWVKKILNGEKTIEIRKRFPKDYVGWIYIYCTKSRQAFHGSISVGYEDVYKLPNGKWEIGCAMALSCYYPHEEDIYEKYEANCKVVARFWCDKVEKHNETTKDWLCRSLYEMKVFADLCDKACVDEVKMHLYAKGKPIYAIHISKLEIFDKPKELSEFKHPYVHCSMACDNNFEKSFCRNYCSHNQDGERLAVWCDRDDKVGDTLTKAPQSWQYVEVE